MNSLHGQPLRKDIDEEYIIKSKNWLAINNDEKVVEYEPLQNGEFAIKTKKDPGIEKIKEVGKSMPSNLGIFILPHSKKTMNKNFHVIKGFCPNEVYYQDTDSMYTQMDTYEKSKEAGYVGKNLGRRKNG